LASFSSKKDKQYDVIVIGAGFAGAAFSRVMADSGKKVLVLEKRPPIGGNMYDENSGDNQPRS
jgi:UDP-galactopyranose mutase